MFASARESMGGISDSHSMGSRASTRSSDPRVSFGRRFSLRGLFSTITERRHRSSVKSQKRISASAAHTDESVERQMPGHKVHASTLQANSDECALCFTQPDAFYMLISCNHRYCTVCLAQYIYYQVTEARAQIHCPDSHCQHFLHPNDVKHLVGGEESALYTKYQDFLLMRALANELDVRFCPAPDCPYAVIASNCAECPQLSCLRPSCGTLFCYHCRDYWHPGTTCEIARARKAPNKADLTLLLQNIKQCPRCRNGIEKYDDGSCNHITCGICKTDFCWLCLQEITDLHYLSPSGCTFWGKKVWSQKKKFMWQIAMLTLAPLGVVLLAGVTLPILIIGAPIFAGRKIFHSMKNRRRVTRALGVTTGVITALIVAPAVAALVVGVGVPIVLVYVYAVVPITLCKSRACGHSSAQKEEADELQGKLETHISSDIATERFRRSMASELVSIGAGSNVLGVNASLAESTSLHITLDNQGDLSDRDSASIYPHAASLSGSVCSNLPQKSRDRQDHSEVQSTSKQHERVNSIDSLQVDNLSIVSSQKQKPEKSVSFSPADQPDVWTKRPGTDVITTESKLQWAAEHTSRSPPPGGKSSRSFTPDPASGEDCIFIDSTAV